MNSDDAWSNSRFEEEDDDESSIAGTASSMGGTQRRSRRDGERRATRSSVGGGGGDGTASITSTPASQPSARTPLSTSRSRRTDSSVTSSGGGKRTRRRDGRRAATQDETRSTASQHQQPMMAVDDMLAGDGDDGFVMDAMSRALRNSPFVPVIHARASQRASSQQQQQQNQPGVHAPPAVGLGNGNLGQAAFGTDVVQEGGAARGGGGAMGPPAAAAAAQQPAANAEPAEFRLEFANNGDAYVIDDLQAALTIIEQLASCVEPIVMEDNAARKVKVMLAVAVATVRAPADMGARIMNAEQIDDDAQAAFLTSEGIDMAEDARVKALIAAFTTVLNAANMNDDDKMEYHAIAVECMSVFNNVYTACRNILLIGQGDHVQSARNLLNMFRHDSEVFNGFGKEMLRLKMAMSEAMAERQYRRGPRQSMLYSQVFTPEGYSTRFWRPHIRMCDFFNKITEDRTRTEMWTTLNENASARSSLENHFNTCDEIQLGTVRPTQGLYAFTNGIYDANRNVYAAYNTALFVQLFPPNVCSYNYFSRCAWDPTGYDAETGEFDWDTHGCRFDAQFEFRPELCPPTHFTATRVPFVTVFMEAQKWDWHVKLVYLYGLGRCMHALNDDEQWALLQAGVAGTGKSTILDFIRESMPAEFQGQLMSNVEETFGLQDHITDDDKNAFHLTYVADMGSKISLAWDIMNNAVEGTAVVSPVKSKKVRRVDKWLAPWFINTNADFFAPPLHQLESLFRRWPIFKVMLRPTGPIPTVEGFQLHMATFLRCTHLAYHEWRRRLALWRATGAIVGGNIWDHLPAYFTERKREVLIRKSPICKFLLTPTWFRKSFNPNYKMSIDAVQHAYRCYQSHQKAAGGASGGAGGDGGDGGGAGGGKGGGSTLEPAHVFSTLLQLCYGGAANYNGTFTCDLTGIHYVDTQYVLGYEIAPNSYISTVIDACVLSHSSMTLADADIGPAGRHHTGAEEMAALQLGGMEISGTTTTGGGQHALQQRQGRAGTARPIVAIGGAKKTSSTARPTAPAASTATVSSMDEDDDRHRHAEPFLGSRRGHRRQGGPTSMPMFDDPDDEEMRIAPPPAVRPMRVEMDEDED